MLNQLKPLIQQQSKRKRGRKAKARPVYVSRKLELDYTRALLVIVDDIHTETVKALMPLIDTPNIGDSRRQVIDSLFSDFKTAFSKTANTVKAKVSGIASALAQTVVSKQGQQSDGQLSAMILSKTGIDFSGLMSDEVLQEAVDEAVAANIALINSIPQQYLDRVEQAVMASLQAGTLNTTLADELLKIEGVTKNRAKLIARDQLGKINSRLSQIRQQSLGITHYFWSTSHDERVRDRHNRWDGDRIAWDTPTMDGHPGQPIQCRCTAIPDLDFLME
ncbi:minor capsid protein [Psychrobacter cryohalolentis]|uniref:phage head morphogenesis protein n=1 Tax=Psychrobacter sp. D2 TaxID=2759702 RepID=UPI0015E60D81|nr:phage minor head protein [Psychrobacter sp. D2]MBA2057336.1 minor capsid protein [Psychrobacter sp. D2]